MKKLLTILFLCLAFISNAQTVSITSSASGAICAGTSVTFTANPTGITSPTFQWYKNGTAISGETNITYVSSSLSNNDQISVKATPGYTAGSISTTGLIANFDAANYNTTSTRWNDQSSSANHMDFYTDRTYSTLKTATYSTEGGGSLNVNNNSVFGKTISNTGISGNGGKTMSAWIKFDAKDVTWSSVASIGEYLAGKVFEIYVQVYPNSQLLFHWSGGQLQYNSDLAQNTWYYVTIKSDGSSGNYIYINGIQVAYATQTLNITNSPLYMGAPKTNSQGGWDYNLRGKISTISLYNTALSAQTILDNYNATKGRYTSSSVNSNTITTTVNASPSIPTITVTGDACINKTTLTTTSGLSSYTWYKDNVAITGATSNTYTPTIAGAYKVVVSNGTCSTTSTATAIYSCGVTADGSMGVLETSTTLVSKDGAKNNGKGIDENGKILSKPWVYGTVTTRTGRIWMDRNLGASRVATSSTDTQAYGDYYQWGRPADGHEKQIVSGTASDYTTVRSSTSVPGNSKYIFPSDGSNDWLITPDNTLWTGVNAPNNPCPAGFRIPTEAEWAAEAAVFTSNNVAGSFESGYGLRLTLAGMADSPNHINQIGNFGQYLTQTAYNDGKVRYFGVISWATWFDWNYFKITGQSCRCIKD